MGYRGNVSDESGVRPTLSVVAADDGPCALLPSLLCKTEIKILDITLRDCTWFILSTFLDLFLQFLLFLALESISFMEGKSEWSCTYGSRFSRNSHEGTDQQIISSNLSENCQHEREAQATLVLIFIGQCCCEFLRFLDVFYSHLQRSVNLQSQRSTGSFLNPKKRSVLTTVIYGKFNNRSSCLVKTEWQQNVFYGSSPETAEERKAGQM